MSGEEAVNIDLGRVNGRRRHRLCRDSNQARTRFNLLELSVWVTLLIKFSITILRGQF